ncbi:hypothetical protein BC829DRAFT_400691 [Chytridium lagenaria]|nr:hypothetical protein BC829DRAFT_400691 [Chytridium lagenaria]
MPSLTTLITAAFIAINGAASVSAQQETVDINILSSLLSSISVPTGIPTAVQDIATNTISVPTFTRPAVTGIPTFTSPVAVPTPASPITQCSDPKGLTCAVALMAESQALPQPCVEELNRLAPTTTTASSSFMQPGLSAPFSGNSTINLPQCVCPIFVNFANCISPVCSASANDIKKTIPNCFPKSDGVRVNAFGALSLVAGVVAMVMM